MLEHRAKQVNSALRSPSAKCHLETLQVGVGIAWRRAAVRDLTFADRISMRGMRARHLDQTRKLDAYYSYGSVN